VGAKVKPCTKFEVCSFTVLNSSVQQQFSANYIVLNCALVGLQRDYTLCKKFTVGTLVTWITLLKIMLVEQKPTMCVLMCVITQDVYML